MNSTSSRLFSERTEGCFRLLISSLTVWIWIEATWSVYDFIGVIFR